MADRLSGLALTRALHARAPASSGILQELLALLGTTCLLKSQRPSLHFGQMGQISEPSQNHVTDSLFCGFLPLWHLAGRFTGLS